ncbi:Ribonucleases P/MRP protein subunit pop1 [Yamadazyma tenuis]|uniref:POPLD-domain-containing protein n=1 Tax=Candida tenuis (strain ATCC 10573 / BCRC 21748 / CBS 615 / JCM 9827 / NBRC 10315 / NRRL Y-1498 / VKM Y-70) TaxID=590646 RepID=G3B7X7_CANTC|nr:uncharacterized protein CANTEDRAFT_124668 [Yamadazyma tenuis ATCC 10573]EGV61680.1 hypothetical protein CANTEDRAFT_124668 [Yamadazyma tenuis ATCC 10573]WEJ92907.1 Ribonucleases P/MRP protein subunit pop1 [Yamadazyma tenuis]
MDKRKKIFNTRTIRTELADPAYKDGLLSVPEFLGARSFEIRSFEISQLKTRASAANRVFQSLPRILRRRTASHNVKRVPKRLRNRAIREMQDTNITKKKPTSKQIYQLRMSKKLLKLASRVKLLKSVPIDSQTHMKSRIKQLNEQLADLRSSKSHNKPVLNNIMGSYDNTGVNELAVRPKGNLKYSKRQREHVWLTTHVWHAKRFHLVKRWGYQIPLSPTQKCFKSTNRAAKSNTIIFDTSYFDSLIMDYDETVISNLIKPSISVLKGHKSYNGWLYIDSKPVGICLMYCSPAAGKTLLRIHPSIYEELFNHIRETYGVNLQDCRYSLGSIELVGPTSLRSLNKIFHITKEIPEFKNLCNYNDDFQPGTTMSFNIKDPRLWSKPVNPPVSQEMSYNDLIIKLSSGLIDQESILQLFDPEGRNHSYLNQHTTKELNKHPDPAGINESIPILLTKTSSSWCLIVPWFWVLPIWLKLNQISHIHLGGMNQLKQLDFENGRLSYLEDYPYLPESWIDNELQIKLSQQKYNKLPLSKRQREKFEKGLLSFGNDWEFLTKLIFITKKVGKLEDKFEFGQFDENMVKQIRSVDDLVDHVDSSRNFKLCIELFDPNNSFHQSFTRGDYKVDLSKLPKLPIRIVRFELPNGTLNDHARIYVENASHIQNLVGFVTTGGYNLNRGKMAGIGYISAHIPEGTNLVIRNIGTSKEHKIKLI